MKSALKLMACVLTAYAFVPAVYAADSVTFNIPFAFSVGAKTLPAGTYDVKRDLQHHTVAIQKSDYSAAQVMFGFAVIGDRTPAPICRMVFHKYGETYFLNALWIQGSATGTEFRTSSAEREQMAKASSVAIVARR